MQNACILHQRSMHIAIYTYAYALDCHTKIGPPQKWSPGPIFAKKMVPGPILAAKIGLPGLILAAKIGPPLPKTLTVPSLIYDARTKFGKHDLLANNYTNSYRYIAISSMLSSYAGSKNSDSNSAGRISSVIDISAKPRAGRVSFVLGISAKPRASYRYMHMYI